jgi:UDP-GlcNAc:undecaprenyl-phosphate GlcNAc-1-phosphate transferase
MSFGLIVLLAVLATLFICVNADSLGAQFGVVAHPDHRRKHALPTPQLGGVAILVGFTIWAICELFYMGSRSDPILLAVLFTGGGLGMVGFVDDQREVSPTLRILLVLVFLGIAFALDSRLISPVLHWYSFSSTAIPPWVYVPLMALTAIGLVNSVNMADGQNGLVGSMFATWTACLVIVSTGELQVMAGMFFALSLVFLAFNLRGKVFLGDCGSYGVTFAIGLMVTLAHAQGRVSLETIIVWFFLPVIDCLRLLISRPLQGRGFFEGGRDHFHHRLIDSMGLRLSAVTYIFVVAASSIIATMTPKYSLVVLCSLCAFYFTFARLSEGEVEELTEGEEMLRSSLNVVPLSNNTRRENGKSWAIDGS